MTIIETCSAPPRAFHASPDVAGTACVTDPLHAIAGSWLGPVVQPVVGPGGPAPRPRLAMRCNDGPAWR